MHLAELKMCLPKRDTWAQPEEAAQHSREDITHAYMPWLHGVVLVRAALGLTMWRRP